MAPPEINVIFSAGPTSKRTAWVGSDFFHGAQMASAAPAAITATAATAGNSHVLREGDGVTSWMPLLVELADALVGPARSISSSVGLRSCAECQRSAGFFSRHLRTTRSSDRGAAGWNCWMGAG